MSFIELYLFFVILPNISTLIGITFICCTIGIGTSLFISAVSSADSSEFAMKALGVAKKFGAAAIILGILSIPIPDETQIYKLAGVYIVANTKDIKKLPDNLVGAANAWLEKAAKAAADKPATK